jgi:tungstate transport system ATP-binding protein
MISHIDAVKITKKYDGVPVLDQINLRASSDHITSIVGVNGAGKTTLLRILAGLDTMHAGKVLIDGKDARPDELRTCCTMIFQRSVMFGGTVFDNVAYGLRVNRTPRRHINDKVKSAIGIVNLEGFEKRKARKLSSGEQQRVAIARALAIDRDVLLIDEPTANIDPANTMIIEQGIKESARSRVVLLSTHNLTQARRLSHRMIHLHRGCVVEERDTTDFFANPHDELTKLFINGELQF